MPLVNVYVVVPDTFTVDTMPFVDKLRKYMVNVFLLLLFSVQEATSWLDDWENAKLVVATGTPYATVDEFADVLVALPAKDDWM